MRNERRVVRFKDVEWGDYFPKRVNTVPMSVFHFPRAERSCMSADGPVNLGESAGSISLGTMTAATIWGKYTSEDSGDYSQYWD